MRFIGTKDDLKELGFVRSAEKDYWELRKEQYIIFIPAKKKSIDYEYNKVYVEPIEHNMIIDDLDIFYYLVRTGLFII